MIPPLASSLPETGRKRTETSTSLNLWSSSTATAHGCVSTVCARTCRPSDVRRTQCPVTNFHLVFSTPRSYFMVVFSPAATTGSAIATSNTAVSTVFMGSSLCRSVQTLGDHLPLVAPHQRELDDGSPAVERGDHADGAVAGILPNAASVASASDRFASASAVL